MNLEEWLNEVPPADWVEPEDVSGHLLSRELLESLWQAAMAARDEDWKAVVGATLGDVANVREQATAAEQVRLARWLRDEAYCLDGSDQKGTRDTLLRHADCLDAMREAMGGE